MTGTTGKWREPGVPHKGWTCIEIEDLEKERYVCEMCEVQVIRYVHTMTHPNHEQLAVGCVCAGHMEGDSINARRREATFKNYLSQRSTWLISRWRISLRGNQYLNRDGFNIVVFKTERRGWCACISDRRIEDKQYLRRTYETADQAKLAAFDELMKRKDARKNS